jgi:proteasome lid subunit RPN8/RPN11
MTAEKRSYCAGCKEFDPKNPRAVCGFVCAVPGTSVQVITVSTEADSMDPEQPELFGTQGAHP